MKESKAASEYQKNHNHYHERFFFLCKCINIGYVSIIMDQSMRYSETLSMRLDGHLFFTIIFALPLILLCCNKQP
jgi:hypothetical protein